MAYVPQSSPLVSAYVSTARYFMRRRMLPLIILCLSVAIDAMTQDSPGRFEAGGNFTALHTDSGASFGPGVEGAFNFGRHFSLDAAFNWMPTNPEYNPGHVLQGLFGGKVGTRTKHFGFFGKVRPGFVSFANALRQETISLGPPASGSIRFARLTERAIDFGGVIEYYPAKHWALRYDFGDTVIFGEAAQISFIGSLPGTSFATSIPGRNTNNFQFSTGVHYRF